MSLRERNRRETWSALYEAAASLAEQRGPAAVTVDDIAARAGVSKRTFFNYFGTKEDAMLGFREPTLSEAAIAEFRDGAGRRPLVERAVTLIVAAIHASTDLPHTGGRRMALVRQHPELRSRLDALAGMLESLVAPLIAAELGAAHAPLDASVERDDDQRRAAAAFMLATTIVRFTYKTDLARVAEGDARDERAALDAALEMFRDLLQKDS